MSEANNPIHDLPDDEWARLNQIVARFEEALRLGGRPAIEDCLKGTDVNRRALLVELVHAELEHRLHARQPARVESYLERFPELADDREAILDLLSAEFECRRTNEPSLAVDEFLQRFPQYRDDLAARLKAPAPRRRRFPIRINCPHCHNPIQIVSESPDEEVVCPSCGSSFKLDPNRTTSWSPEKLPRLGKFELLEAVGRGAFGTVYRARDTELERIVAVKVPRSGQLATQEDEDRFHREARSVAQLRHPAIVPVYEVGRSETFPYIVSEYVEGITLSDALTGRRFGFREAAELVAQVADALDHAHQHGVVHRDLKPSNIMLEKSGIRGQVSGVRTQESRGNGEGTSPSSLNPEPQTLTPRLMDFGLARRDEGEITVTVDGQVLGTPAYMSPEQARGEGHRVDGRSDVYSLGVILYELLAGELPFRGNSRMLLHQVMNEEPRPPRKLNDRITRDLETITLKCMSKEPNRRYQSAGYLAADLRRYLNGEPIYARPIGAAERIWRWCRRNPRVASLTAGVFLSLLFIAAGSSVAATVIYRQREAARQLADANRVLAAQEATARELADERFRQARKAVDDFLTAVAQDPELKQSPRSRPLRRRLLERAKEYYDDFLKQRADDRQLQADVAEAYGNLGLITMEVSPGPAALEYYEKMCEMYESLVRFHPVAPEYRSELASAYNSLGYIHQSTGEDDNAERAFQKAIEIRENLVRDHPDVPNYRSPLVGLYGNLGLLQAKLGLRNEAERAHQRAIDIGGTLVRDYPELPEYQNDLAGAYNNLGILQESTGNRNEAERTYLKAIEIWEALVQSHPDRLQYRIDSAHGYVNYGNLQRKVGRSDEAERASKKAIEIREALVRDHPEVPRYREGLKTAILNLGDLHDEMGNWIEAEVSYKKAIDISEVLVREHPHVLEYRNGLARTNVLLGASRVGAGQLAAAELAYQKAVEISEPMVLDHPQVSEYSIVLGGSYCNLGNLALRRADPQVAKGWYSKAVGTLQRTLKQDNSNVRAREFLRNSYWGQAQANDQLGLNDKAVADWSRAIELNVGKRHEVLRVGLIFSLVRAKQHAAATAEALSLADAEVTTAGTLYNVGCVFSLASAVAQHDTNMDEADRIKLADQYVARAVEHLHRARASGFFRDPANIDRLKKDPDLDPLRAREDSLSFLEQLNQQGQTGTP